MHKQLNEKCAVVGVFNISNASKTAFFSLFALQHRGQEAAGIASSNGKKIFTIKDKGLVTSVFDDQKLMTLKGDMAVGHTRYSTAGEDSILDAQPVYARYDLGEIAVVHNGNLTNAQSVRDKLISKGAIFQTFMDTENMIHLIAKSDENELLNRIIDATKKVEGAYSMIIQSRSKMFAMRDPYGFRPLSLAKLDDGYIVASETCAFDLIGATFIRDINPGELLVFRKGKEPVSMQIQEPTPKRCIFEYIYFSRPDSNVYGQNVYFLRKKMGEALALVAPVQADIVVPVPDGGTPGAIGYAKASGIAFEMAIIRNHYIGRTFIEPIQENRHLKVKMKLSPIKKIINGKRVVIIDDSIVRGTTSKKIVDLLREAGAKEVHFRVFSPPMKHPCFYGVDTPNKDKLIASNMSNEEICNYIGADSLAFLSAEDLYKSVNNTNNSYCAACFTGEYLI